MQYMPHIDDAIRVKTIALDTGRHTALLFSDIESSGLVQYLYVLAVIDDETGEPCVFVASEVNAMAEQTGGGSHFLGLFPGQGHVNLGASDNWADLDQFEVEAIRVAKIHLNDK